MSSTYSDIIRLLHNYLSLWISKKKLNMHLIYINNTVIFHFKSDYIQEFLPKGFQSPDGIKDVKISILTLEYSQSCPLINIMDT